jgi:hypothetical protein
MTNSKNGVFVSTGNPLSRDIDTGFLLQGIADGDYDIFAQSTIDDDTAVSDLQHVTVKGSDVTGVLLQLSKLGTIVGTFTLEPTSLDIEDNCKDVKKNLIVETALYPRLENQDVENDPILFTLARGKTATANDDGSFVVKDLVPGKYRLGVKLPNDSWFIRTMSSAANKSSNLRRDIVTLKSGQRIDGITIAVSAGGAVIRGRLISASGAKTIPTGLRVFLVPTDSQAMYDVFQYFDAPVQDDGDIVLKNLRPGKYYIIVRPDMQNQSSTVFTTMDDKARAKLFSDAQSLNSTIEIQPCQQLNNFIISYPQKSGQ